MAAPSPAYTPSIMFQGLHPFDCMCKCDCLGSKWNPFPPKSLQVKKGICPCKRVIYEICRIKSPKTVPLVSFCKQAHIYWLSKQARLRVTGFLSHAKAPAPFVLCMCLLRKQTSTALIENVSVHQIPHVSTGCMHRCSCPASPNGTFSRVTRARVGCTQLIPCTGIVQKE